MYVIVTSTTITTTEAKTEEREVAPGRARGVWLGATATKATRNRAAPTTRLLDPNLPPGSGEHRGLPLQTPVSVIFFILIFLFIVFSFFILSLFSLYLYSAKCKRQLIEIREHTPEPRYLRNICTVCKNMNFIAL